MAHRYFFIAFAAAFLVLSVLFLFLMLTVHPAAPNSTNQAPAAELELSAPYTPEASDCLNVLFIGSESGAAQANSYILARFNPVRGAVPVVVFPPGTLVQNNGRTEPLADVFTFGGADHTRNALSRTLGIPIDRYVRIQSGAFLTCASTIGSIEYKLSKDLVLSRHGRSITLNAGVQYLDGQKVLDIAAYGSEDEIIRCHMAGDLTAAIVNQRIDVVESTLIDKIFETVINIIDTDISYPDYDNRREAAVFLARLGKEPAYSLPVSGHLSDGAFTLSDTFLAQLATAFA